ncbi:MAG: DUF3800 domain-containing protein [Candidatus Daviesbacteria bacterium]|nr:DUF3800 domain-containing protein [Candidatus Daviesbacteria bacterium]
MAIAMLIFMDESGDTGFKFSKTSSRFFVLVIIIFDSLADAEKANEAVKEIRKELKLPENFEFKFSTGTSDKYKKVFLQKLSKFNFRYRTVIVDKTILAKQNPIYPKDSLYMIVADHLFLRAESRMKNASIFIDRISKSFVDDFNGYLRKRLNTNIEKIIGRLKHQDSKSNNLLQLADMVCGAIYRKYNRGEEKFYKIIKKREEDLWKPY